MKVAVMQPTYLPWIGYFDLMDQVDAFVLLEDVQFSKQSWQQRNRIKTAQGLTWLTVPVLTKGRSGQRLYEVKWGEHRFIQKHLKSIEQSYKNAPNFERVMPSVRQAYESVDEKSSLTQLNGALIGCVRTLLEITTPVTSSLEVETRDDRQHRVPDICKSLGATTYISPLGALNYLQHDIDAFEQVGVDVRFHNYEHPTYEQLYPPFSPYSAALDLLFNSSELSLDIMRSGRGEPYTLEQASLL